MKYLRTACFAVCAVLCVSLPVSAASSNSYVYDSEGNVRAVAEPYQTAAYLSSAEDFGGQRLSGPSDLFVANEDTVYILDAGNNRVVVLDGRLQYQTSVTLSDGGEPVAFGEAKSIFVAKDGTMYIADKGAKVVYVADPDGTVKARITAPPADKVEANFEFTPSSVVADTAGIVYVVSSSSYSGALQYDTQYEFVGFYGSDQVIVTDKVLLNEFWKRILSDEAASGLSRNVPTSIIGLDIDDKNFIYTLRGGTSTGAAGQIRKLNTLGFNILLNSEGSVGNYGDTDTYYDSGKNLTVASSLIDLAVDRDGFITVLDRTYNRLFQYDQSTNMLYAFGGSEKRYGNFTSPVAVDTVGDLLLVLDDSANALTAMQPTAFARNVRQATLLNADGRCAEARPYWEEVLKIDAYYGLANYGMGMVYEEQEDYANAMTYYRLANSKEGYSSAFAAERDLWVKAHFAYILAGVVLLLAGMVAGVNFLERHRKNEYDVHVTKAGYPLYCFKHPFKAYYELKVDKKGSLLAANGILAVFFLLSVMQSQLTSFHFAKSNPEDFNVFLTLGSTIGLFVLFVLCNWAVSTLADGEGTLKEIWIFTAYALIPYCVTTAVMIALSHMFSLEESTFWTVFWVIGILWTALHLFMSNREVHQYTVKKAILLLLVTFLGMYLLVLIITLGYSLFTQLLSFIGTVYNEIRLK